MTGKTQLQVRQVDEVLSALSKYAFLRFTEISILNIHSYLSKMKITYPDEARLIDFVMQSHSINAVPLVVK